MKIAGAFEVDLDESGRLVLQEALELRSMGHAWKNVQVLAARGGSTEGLLYSHRGLLEGGLVKWDEKGYPIYKEKTPE